MGNEPEREERKTVMVHKTSTPFKAKGRSLSKDFQQDEGSESSDEDLWMEQEQAPLVGLVNLGNTCYANAALQVLFAIPELNIYFLQRQFLRIKHSSKLKLHRTCVALADVLKQVFSCKEGNSVRPIAILSKCARGQQDSHEFLYKDLFTTIQDETNPSISGERKLEWNRDQHWHWYRTRFTSILDQLMGGQFENRIICDFCNNISQHYEHFIGLSLPVISPTLENCLHAEFLKATVQRYDCSRCGQKGTAFKHTRIDKTPRYLLLHLKRLQANNVKNTAYIKYPEKLEISPYCASGRKLRIYTLLAVCVHDGGAASGHFTAFVKRNGKWFFFDDEVVKPVPKLRVFCQQAYLLLYLRVRPSI